MSMKLSALQKRQRDVRELIHGPRGGRLRGKARPTIKQAEKAFAAWPHRERAWVIFWLILTGLVR
jgi:hypothetical protein